MEMLDRLLATLFVARQNIHARHFNVTGRHFRTLHLMFQECYELLDKWYDNVGELIRRQRNYAIYNIPEMYAISSVKSDDEILVDEIMTAMTAGELLVLKEECERAVNSGYFDNATQNDLSQFASDLSEMWYKVGSWLGDTIPD